MFRSISRLGRAVRLTIPSPRKSITTESAADIGKRVFRGAVAEHYLAQVGLPKDTLLTADWISNGNADRVANAVSLWAKANGASTATHWFQPMACGGTRHGMASGVQTKMYDFDPVTGELQWDFKGKNLILGETDGSSYINGGLRQTHKAGAYSTIDPTSPLFIRGDTMFIPASLVSYDGHALDEKIPLLRAQHALSREGSRLLRLLGATEEHTQSVFPCIGLEQELFFMDRKAFLSRPDLRMIGRTVVGAVGPRGQDLCDHYMAPLSPPVLACMQEIQDQCYDIGIPLRTRHREVAPNQFEFAPAFGTSTTQIDQNLVVMQIIDEVSRKFGLAALFAEKPFAGVNGSGKHNNWSLFTSAGVNLFNPQQLAKAALPKAIFPVVMAAVVQAVSKHGDLMRMSIAAPGNDFRLGACEAPPAIITTYLGESLMEYLKGYSMCNSEATVASLNVYQAAVKTLDVGGGCVPVTVPAEDRNRTSPFAFGGHRFEFRAVGSSQNVSMVNTVLATIVAAQFKAFSDAIEGLGGQVPQTPFKVASAALRNHLRVVFNGDGYCEKNQRMLVEERGLLRMDSGIDAIARMTSPENAALFESMGVFRIPEELVARQAGMLQLYVETVRVEAACLRDIALKYYDRELQEEGGSVEEGCSMTEELWDMLVELRSEMRALEGGAHGGPVPAASDAAAEHNAELLSRARRARVLRLEKMVAWRRTLEGLDENRSADDCPVTPYSELLFVEHN